MSVGCWLVRSGPYVIIRRHFGIFYAMLAWGAGLWGWAGELGRGVGLGSGVVGLAWGAGLKAGLGAWVVGLGGWAGGLGSWAGLAPCPGLAG